MSDLKKKVWQETKNVLAIREIINIVTEQESFFNVRSTKSTKLALIQFYNSMPENEKITPTMEEQRKIRTTIKMLDKNQQLTILHIIGNDDTSDGKNILKLFAAIIRTENEEALVTFLKNGFVNESINSKVNTLLSKVNKGLNEFNERYESRRDPSDPNIKDKVLLTSMSKYSCRQFLKLEKNNIEKICFSTALFLFSVLSFATYFFVTRFHIVALIQKIFNIH